MKINLEKGYHYYSHLKNPDSKGLSLEHYCYLMDNPRAKLDEAGKLILSFADLDISWWIETVKNREFLKFLASLPGNLSIFRFNDNFDIDFVNSLQEKTKEVIPLAVNNNKPLYFFTEDEYCLACGVSTPKGYDFSIEKLAMNFQAPKEERDKARKYILSKLPNNIEDMAEIISRSCLDFIDFPFHELKKLNEYPLRKRNVISRAGMLSVKKTEEDILNLLGFLKAWSGHLSLKEFIIEDRIFNSALYSEDVEKIIEDFDF